MTNPTTHTPEREERFLTALSETANVTLACKLAGVPRLTIYGWRDADPAFKARWAEALDRGVEALEDEMMRRAKEGVDRPVFYQGEECGAIREYSDTLAIFLAKGARPEKYRENIKTEITGTLTLEQLVTQAAAPKKEGT